MNKILKKALPLLSLALFGQTTALQAANTYVQIGDLYFFLTTKAYEGEEGALQAGISTPKGLTVWEAGTYVGDIVVPESFTYQNQKYYVTSVEENCFYNQSGVTSVKLPQTIKTIGGYAFNTTSIKELTLPASVDSMGMMVYGRTNTLTKLTCKAVTPPKGTNINMSMSPDAADVEFYVPAGSVDAYKASAAWKVFTKIQVIAEEQILPTAITVDPTSFKDYIGGKFTLTATVAPENADDKTLIFTSSNPEVATVDAVGNVALVGKGECDIIVSAKVAPEVKAVCRVVSEEDLRVFPTEVKVNMSNILRPVGDRFKLEVTVLPEDCFDKSYTILSSYPDIVSVDEEGYLCLKKTGVSFLTVYANVDHRVGTSVSVTSRPDTLEVDGLTYKIYPEVWTAKLVGAPTSVATINVPERFLTNYTEKIYCSVIEIGEKAFADHTNLKKVILPESVDSIGLSAFKGCTSLESVNIPSKVKTIPGAAFSGSGLKVFDIPDNVETIDNQAFMNCTKLDSINIGNGVKMIYLQAFDGSAALRSIVSKSTVPPTFFKASLPAGMTLDPFAPSIYPTCVLEVPETAIPAYKAAYVWEDFANVKPIGYLGVEEAMAEDVNSSAVRYFNLQGLEVTRPEKGQIVIEVKDGKNRKIRF